MKSGRKQARKERSARGFEPDSASEWGINGVQRGTGQSTLSRETKLPAANRDREHKCFLCSGHPKQKWPPYTVESQLAIMNGDDQYHPPALTSERKTWDSKDLVRPVRSTFRDGGLYLAVEEPVCHYWFSPDLFL